MKFYGKSDLVHHNDPMQCITHRNWNLRMWFWSGKTVKETEISDITAYNHANGIMWIVYSIIYWMAAFAGIWNSIAALDLIIVGCVIGIPVLVVVYNRIYARYKA